MPQTVEDFSVHASAPVSSQAKNLASSMEALGLSQVILGPTHQAAHMLDLILGEKIEVDLITADVVP